MKNYLRKGLLTLLLTLITCCMFSIGTQAAPKKITFAAKSKKVTMYASQKKALKVKVPKKYKDKKIQFTSSNPTVAKVTKKGVVKALHKGNVKIYAKVKGTKKKAKANIKILQNAEQITISNTPEKYYVKKKYTLAYQTVPQIIDEDIKWKSSDKSIATINKKSGLLKVKDEGIVTITAYSNKTKKEESITIHTEYVPEIRIKEGKNIQLNYGESIQLHLEFINHPKVNMTFSTPDDLVKVSPSGYVTTTRPGTAYITAMSADKKYKVTTVLHIGLKNGFVSNVMLKNLDIDDCTNLMIVAHPDDETLWGGAHLMEGKWFVVCMTNQYFTLRKTEYQKVLDDLGIKGIILDYPDIYKGIDGKWKIDRWQYNIQDALADDIMTIINYKNWNQIVSHSPTGETGHFHHKYVNKAVVNSCQSNAQKFDKLWYFGKFYQKGLVPVGLPQITPEALTRKEALLKYYVREQGSIKSYWEQMNPYENWEKATNYK